MSGFVRHTYHFDVDFVRDTLSEAESLVDSLGVAEDLRPVAYTNAINLLTARFSVMEQVNAGGVILDGQGGR